MLEINERNRFDSKELYDAMFDHESTHKGFTFELRKSFNQLDNDLPGQFFVQELPDLHTQHILVPYQQSNEEKSLKKENKDEKVVIERTAQINYELTSNLPMANIRKRTVFVEGFTYLQDPENHPVEKDALFYRQVVSFLTESGSLAFRNQLLFKSFGGKDSIMSFMKKLGHGQFYADHFALIDNDNKFMIIENKSEVIKKHYENFCQMKGPSLKDLEILSLKFRIELSNESQMKSDDFRRLKINKANISGEEIKNVDLENEVWKNFDKNLTEVWDEFKNELKILINEFNDSKIVDRRYYEARNFLRKYLENLKKEFFFFNYENISKLLNAPQNEDLFTENINQIKEEEIKKELQNLYEKITKFLSNYFKKLKSALDNSTTDQTIRSSLIEREKKISVASLRHYNSRVKNVYTLLRYSLENYVLDPINLFCYLNYMKESGSARFEIKLTDLNNGLLNYFNKLDSPDNDPEIIEIINENKEIRNVEEISRKLGQEKGYKLVQGIVTVVGRMIVDYLVKKNDGSDIFRLFKFEKLAYIKNLIPILRFTNDKKFIDGIYTLKKTLSGQNKTWPQRFIEEWESQLDLLIDDSSEKTQKEDELGQVKQQIEQLNKQTGQTELLNEFIKIIRKQLLDETVDCYFVGFENRPFKYPRVFYLLNGHCLEEIVHGLFINNKYVKSRLVDEIVREDGLMNKCGYLVPNELREIFQRIGSFELEAYNE